MQKKCTIVWLAVLLPLGLWGQQFTRELQFQDTRMNGPDVKLLQEKLLSLGFSEVGEADGWFGRKTEYAVEKCQMFFGFAPDGVVRKDFFTALYKTDKLTLELIDMIKRANAIDEKLEHLDSISFEDIKPDARSHGLPCYWNVYYKNNTVEKVDMSEPYEASSSSAALYLFSNGDKFFASSWILGQMNFNEALQYMEVKKDYYANSYLIRKNKTYAIKNGQLIADETRKELEYHINRFRDVHLDYLLK